MPIAEADIHLRYSRADATAGMASAGTPAGSLGRFVSTTRIADATLNNLFDEISADENAAFDDEYRCFFVHNNHPTLTLKKTKVWVVAEIVGGAEHAIAVDYFPTSPATSTTPQADGVPDEESPPSILLPEGHSGYGAHPYAVGEYGGVEAPFSGYGDAPYESGLYGGVTPIRFFLPVTKSQALPLGDIPPNHVKAVWVKRSAQASRAVPNDGVTLRIEGQTDP